MDLFNFAGVRGVALDGLTPWLAAQVGAATVAEQGAEAVVVGHDTRTTSPPLVDALTAGVRSAGAAVRFAGVVPTPGLASVCAAEALPGLMVTASHNPPEYNGIKFFSPDGTVAMPETVGAIERRIDDGVVPLGDWDEVGDRVEAVEAARETYLRSILETIDAAAIEGAAFEVVVDPGHGTATTANLALFDRPELGIDFSVINAEPDGRFPGRHSEPVEENLGELKDRVKHSGADIGVAFDGDADRVAFVDETGSYVRGDSIFAALVEAYCGDGDVVVSSIDASQRVLDAAASRDATVELTKMGEAYLVRQCRALWDAGRTVPVGGEGTGGIMFPERLPVRDGANTAARVLEVLARRDDSVGELVAPWVGYHKERIDIPYEGSDELDAMMDRARAWADSQPGEVRSIDDGGVRRDLEGAWTLARPSGTEPLLRVYAEARDESRAASLASELADVVRDP